MARAARNIWAPTPDPLPSPPAPAVPAPIGEAEVAWAESPARLLHDRLVATFVAPPPPRSAEPQLSARAKLGIMVGVSAALWSLIVMAVR